MILLKFSTDKVIRISKYPAYLFSNLRRSYTQKDFVHTQVKLFVQKYIETPG